MPTNPPSFMHVHRIYLESVAALGYAGKNGNDTDTASSAARQRRISAEFLRRLKTAGIQVEERVS